MRMLEKVKMQNSIKMFLILGIFLIAIGGLLLVPRAFSAPVPVRSVTITSEKLDYTKKDPGSFNIEKSAEWIEKGKARITFDVDTIMKTEKKYTDIIFVLDISGSMNGDKLNRVKEDSIDLINMLLSDPNNRGALITFETSSQLVLSLTNNKDELTNAINSLTTTGCTNYYQALVNVDKILKDYKKEENRECIVLFLTDGYPNEDIPNEEGQYSYLRKQYPYVTINGVQYEMGSDVLDPIKKVSDQQFIADMTNLNNVLFEASVAPITYDSFSITDYINDDYFEIDSVDNITSSVGTYSLEYENNTPKVIWNIEKLRSGSKASLTIDVNLKKEFLNTGGIYPTNKKEEIKTEIDEIKEDITSSETPILSSHYQVIYDGNAPVGCTAKNIPETTTRSVFDTVEISNQSTVCDGYQFKGWTIVTDNVKRINQNHFTMPSSDVVLRANWGRMSVAKKVDGKVFTVQTLYKIIDGQASLDNTKSEFVTSSSGINFGESPSNTNGKGVYTIADTKDYEYPVHYFRGAVDNNNVKFAGFCWKIVRTTETGGVKLIYNGVPDATGGCTNEDRVSTQIGGIKFNEKINSPADVGYMYGTRYTSSSKSMGSDYWYQYVGKTRSSRINMSTTEYYYGDSVTYDETTNTYTLNNIAKHLWSSDYSSLKGKYSCFKEAEEGCETVAYLDSPGSSSTYYFALISGETYESLIEKAKSVKWIYGNDVEYVDGTYRLVNQIEVFPMNWNDNVIATVNTHRYTCHTTSNTCASVNYIHDSSSLSAYYMTLKDGKKIDDILREMTTETSNTTNSTIKAKIDNWYSTNMLDYTEKLEDTIWCNDRSISSIGGWDKDNESGGYLYFGGYNRNNMAPFKPSIECPNLNDSFTVSSEKGNGKLTYPIALLTADEIMLAGNSYNYFVHLSQPLWSMTPYSFSGGYADNYGISSLTDLEWAGVGNKYSIRPSISLAPGVMVSDGNGTMFNPYEILLETIE